MNKHTPGMFKAIMLHGEGRSIPVVMAEGPDQVAIIADGTWDDAVLFAAAPDLLAALEAIEARISGTYDNPALIAFGPLSIDAEADCSAIARAAIARARGES